MATFRHPFLTRGTIRLAHRAFVVSRGLVELPDEIGESQGWPKVERDELDVQPSATRGVQSSPTVVAVPDR